MASGAAVRAAGMPMLIAEGLPRSGLDTRALCSTLNGFLGKQRYSKTTHPDPARECGVDFVRGQGTPEPSPAGPQASYPSLPGLAGNSWTHPSSSCQRQWPVPRVLGLGGGGGLHASSNHPSCCRGVVRSPDHQHHQRWHQATYAHGLLRHLHSSTLAAGSSSDSRGSGNSDNPATARITARDRYTTSATRHTHGASSSSSSSSSVSSRAARCTPGRAEAPRHDILRSPAAAYLPSVPTVGAAHAPHAHAPASHARVPNAGQYGAVRHVRPYASTTSSVMTGTDRHAYPAAGAAGPQGLSVQDILGRAKLDTKFEVGYCTKFEMGYCTKFEMGYYTKFEMGYYTKFEMGF